MFLTLQTDVNQSLVLDLANKLQAEGFQTSSHIEIDDDWETCVSCFSSYFHVYSIHKL